MASLGALYTAGVTSLAPSGVVSAGVGGGASVDTLHSADGDGFSAPLVPFPQVVLVVDLQQLPLKCFIHLDQFHSPLPSLFHHQVSLILLDLPYLSSRGL